MLHTYTYVYIKLFYDNVYVKNNEMLTDIIFYLIYVNAGCHYEILFCTIEDGYYQATTTIKK